MVIISLLFEALLLSMVFLFTVITGSDGIVLNELCVISCLISVGRGLFAGMGRNLGRMVGGRRLLFF
jgi:hypothetical protein